MADILREWLHRAIRGAPRTERARTPDRAPSADRDPEGPWLYTDPLDRSWVLSMVPLERDPLLPADRQPRALVCTCEDGWIFAVPTGPGFRADRLTPDEIARLLVAAEGNARAESEWEPSRSEPRTVTDPATGLVYQARFVAPDGRGAAGRTGGAPRGWISFRELGGTWTGRAALSPGISMEALDRDALLRLLHAALEITPHPARRRDARAERSRSARNGSAADRPIILLVDDDVDVRVPLRAHLERAGFTVLEAADGEEALALVAHHAGRIRAVVTDLVMPRVGGRELRWRLSEQHPELPVILMSGFLDGRHLADTVDPAPVWFLSKPFSPAELVEYVRAVLSHSRGTLLPQ